MPTPLAGGQENSFAPQMIFLWPLARGVGKLGRGWRDGRFQNLDIAMEKKSPQEPETGKLPVLSG